uniref:Replication-associated protein n=1 Tax=Rodent circovirus TaxID=2050016 RepID=A0A2H4MZ08_9CIRC|nr:Rep [Rodent circovirus]
MSLDIRRAFAGRWMITVQNYDENKLNEIREFCNQYATYAVIGKEVAPTTGTPHLHVFLKTKQRQIRGSSLLRTGLFDHIEVAKGTDEQCEDYCEKGGDYEEIGEKPKAIIKKKEKDEKIREVTKAYAEMNFLEFRDKYPWFAFHMKDKLEKWRIDGAKMEGPFSGNLREKNIWIWGPPRTGKSKWARSQVVEDKIYMKMANKWWDGFIDNHHKEVLFEDFPKDAGYLASFMKIWADRYSFTAECKGSSRVIHPRQFLLIVTSNYSIDECFEGPDAEAIKARFHEVFIGGPNDIFLTTKIKLNI